MHNAPRSWVEIDEAALIHNIETLSLLAGEQFVAPVIKSNAYGHGAALVGAICDKTPQIPFLCVAYLSEALSLRTSKVKKPILILSSSDEDVAQSIGQNISFTVSDYVSAVAINEIAQTHNCSINIHLKVDTGLSRFGARPEQAARIAAQITQLSNVRLTGVYTHFAAATEEESRRTQMQRKSFAAVIQALKIRNITPPFVHCSNSAAIPFPIAGCTIVRPGISVYGLWPSNHIREYCQQSHPIYQLKPVLRWNTQIIQERQILAGNYIGYEYSCYATRDTRIGLLPIGYYDGYHPQLGNSAHVLVAGKFARVIGRIAMNVISIDITDIPEATIGSQVSLIGPEEPILPSTLAQLAGGCNMRLILCRISPEIPRKAMEQSAQSSQYNPALPLAPKNDSITLV